MLAPWVRQIVSKLISYFSQAKERFVLRMPYDTATLPNWEPHIEKNELALRVVLVSIKSVVIEDLTAPQKRAVHVCKAPFFTHFVPALSYGV